MFLCACPQEIYTSVIKFSIEKTQRLKPQNAMKYILCKKIIYVNISNYHLSSIIFFQGNVYLHLFVHLLFLHIFFLRNDMWNIYHGMLYTCIRFIRFYQEKQYSIKLDHSFVHILRK